MIYLNTRSDGVRYLENFADPTDSQYNGICYSGQAITFDGVNDYIDIQLPAGTREVIYYDNILKKHARAPINLATTLFDWTDYTEWCEMNVEGETPPTDGVSWDEAKQAIRFTGDVRKTVRTPIVIDYNKRYEVYLKVKLEAIDGTNTMYIGGNREDENNLRTTNNWDYSIKVAWHPSLNIWYDISKEYQTGDVRYTNGWKAQLGAASGDDAFTKYWWFGGLWNYTAGDAASILLKDLLITMEDFRFYPPNSIGNITIWNKEVTDEDLAYMDENPEWMSLVSDTLTLLPPATSLLAPEYCLAWYPMCENVDSGAVIYNHVPNAGNDITLTNYTESRRSFESNINIGLQTLAYTQDSIGRITGYTPSYSIGYNIDTEYVDSTWVINPERDWMMEEGVDFNHYVYIYSRVNKTLTKYINGIFSSTEDFLISTDIITTIDTFNSDIIDENGYFITDIVYEEPGTYKLDSTTLDTDIVNATTRQLFKLYDKVPENIENKISEMYEYFSSNYLDLLSIQSIWKLDNFLILSDESSNVLDYITSTENQILDSIYPDGDYVIQI